MRSGTRCSGPTSRSSATTRCAAASTGRIAEAANVSDEQHGGDREPLHAAEAADLGSEGSRSERAIYERQLAIHQQYADEQPKLKPTPPNSTLSRDMTLHRGSREIQIRFFGRAHTDGDIVVFLPRERMVATGDMITSALSYTGDAFVEEWPATLEGVMSLDFDTVLPGHGNVFKGKDHIRNLQAYWRDFYQQATALRKQGVSPEEAAKRIDLTKHAGAIPAAKNPGVDRARRRSHLRPRGKSERAGALASGRSCRFRAFSRDISSYGLFDLRSRSDSSSSSISSSSFFALPMALMISSSFSCMASASRFCVA